MYYSEFISLLASCALSLDLAYSSFTHVTVTLSYAYAQRDLASTSILHVEVDIVDVHYSEKDAEYSSMYVPA